MTQITQARSPIKLSPPVFKPWSLTIARWFLPFWLKRRLRIERVYSNNVEQLVELCRKFQNGNTRLILAFRHPSRDDIFCLSHLLARSLPESGDRYRISLDKPFFAHFFYDRHLPQWAGRTIAWLFPKLGGIAIDRGTIDRDGMDIARNILFEGKLPLAIAPEGNENGLSEAIDPLEPRTAQLGFWCAKDLAASGQFAETTIVPIGIQYYYMNEPWLSLEDTIAKIESEVGIAADRTESISTIRHGEPKHMKRILYDRIYKLAQYFLYQMENFYAQFHQYSSPERPDISVGLSRQQIAERLTAVLDYSVHICESHFNLQPKGSIADRCRRIERASRKWIYPKALKNPDNLPPTSKKLADRIATEADLRVWHMRMAETLVAVTGTYIKDRPSVDRFAEITLKIWDLLAQIEGKKNPDRPYLGERIAEVTVGDPISVSPRLQNYLSSRERAKSEVANLTEEIRVALDRMIH
jgi:hypothetical protein